MNLPIELEVVGEPIERLEQDDVGMWLVSGPRTSHLFYMDHPSGRPVYLRITSEQSQKLDFTTGVKVVYQTKVWPEVGREFELKFTDLTWLVSSTVQSIVKVQPKTVTKDEDTKETVK